MPHGKGHKINTGKCAIQTLRLSYIYDLDAMNNLIIWGEEACIGASTGPIDKTDISPMITYMKSTHKSVPFKHS